MRKLTYIFFFLFVSISFAQSEAEYENILMKVTEAYNNKDASAIHQMFSEDLQASFSIDQLKTLIETTHEKKGVLNESTLLINDETGFRFLSHFEKADALIILMLMPNGKLSIFTIEEY